MYLFKKEHLSSQLLPPNIFSIIFSGFFHFYISSLLFNFLPVMLAIRRLHQKVLNGRNFSVEHESGSPYKWVQYKIVRHFTGSPGKLSLRGITKIKSWLIKICSIVQLIMHELIPRQMVCPLIIGTKITRSFSWNLAICFLRFRIHMKNAWINFKMSKKKSK